MSEVHESCWGWWCLPLAPKMSFLGVFFFTESFPHLFNTESESLGRCSFLNVGKAPDSLCDCRKARDSRLPRENNRTHDLHVWFHFYLHRLASFVLAAPPGEAAELCWTSFVRKTPHGNCFSDAQRAIPICSMCGFFLCLNLQHVLVVNLVIFQAWCGAWSILPATPEDWRSFKHPGGRQGMAEETSQNYKMSWDHFRYPAHNGWNPEVFSIQVYLGFLWGYPNSWMFYNGQSCENWWFGGTPIYGNPDWVCLKFEVYHVL